MFFEQKGDVTKSCGKHYYTSTNLHLKELMLIITPFLIHQQTPFDLFAIHLVELNKCL